jgi:two-component system chemotaxis response regulator CheY
VVSTAPVRQPAGAILIVDDNFVTRESLCELLEAVGYRVVGAADGLEGLRRLRDGPIPDLVLVDLAMPKMNGWVFRLQQQQEPDLASVPTVVFSGIHDAESAASWLNADDYMVKPIDPERLFEIVRRFSGTPSGGSHATGLPGASQTSRPGRGHHCRADYEAALEAEEEEEEELARWDR